MGEIVRDVSRYILHRGIFGLVCSVYGVCKEPPTSSDLGEGGNNSI